MTEPELGSRALFPELEARAYLNHASVSPSSRRVREAVLALVDSYAREGFHAFASQVARRDRLRAKLAKLIGAEAAEIAFVQGTTHGVSDVALCFPFRPGDRILVFDGEFPANVTPWQRAAARAGATCVMLSAHAYREDEEAALARLADELERGGGRVRLVAVSAVQFQTGYRMPLAAMSALCRSAGARLFVDAIQAIGIVPFDVRALGVDYLASGSHKWMMGLDGVGFVYARSEVVSELVPSVAGWLSHVEPVSFLRESKAGKLRYDREIRRDIRFVEGGSLASIACAALEAAVDVIQALTPEAIHRHVNAYHDLLEPKLVELGFTSLRASRPEARSGTLSLLPPSHVEPAAVVATLSQEGIICSAPDGRLRLSPHWPNAQDEVDLVARALRRAVC